MIEGRGTKTYNIVKKLIYTEPELVHALLREVTEVVKLYLEKQAGPRRSKRANTSNSAGTT